jgi:predicted ATPase
MVTDAEVPGRLFVGRERELEELSSGLADARAGRGRLFLLVGEAGIGKTRLADELVMPRPRPRSSAGRSSGQAASMCSNGT